jgi:2-oxoglutarate dehydrogenase E2 component (dihydrolipoamide succinyltransferase)
MKNQFYSSTFEGREAVLGLVAMKDALEDPARLLFDI